VKADGAELHQPDRFAHHKDLENRVASFFVLIKKQD